MPDVLAHQVVLVGLYDLEFKVSSTLTPIEGAMELTIDLQGDDQLVKGDDSVVCYAAQQTHAKVTVKQAILDLKARAALLGHTATESGATPNVVYTYEAKTGAIPEGTLTGLVKYVKGVTGITGTVPADAHFVLAKFTVDPNSVKDGLKIGDKNTVEFSGTAIPNSSGVIYSIIFHETYTAIT